MVSHAIRSAFIIPRRFVQIVRSKSVKYFAKAKFTSFTLACLINIWLSCTFLLYKIACNAYEERVVIISVGLSISFRRYRSRRAAEISGFDISSWNAFVRKKGRTIETVYSPLGGRFR